MCQQPYFGTIANSMWEIIKTNEPIYPRLSLDPGDYHDCLLFLLQMLGVTLD